MSRPELPTYVTKTPTEGKTWTQLLGPYQRGDTVDGRMLVTVTGPSRYRIRWVFETVEQAEAAFEEWRRGR